jgi:KDO2-lipid IV(A) lauroyltransferase
VARLPAVAARLEPLGFGFGAAPSVLAGRREVVTRHLRRVVGPSVGERELGALVDATFAAYARYWAESLRLPSLSTAELDAAMSLRGFAHLHDARAGGRGAILALPHLGGWEWGGTWLARTGVPVSVVVEALQEHDVYEWFARFRRGLGLEVIPNGPAAGTACVRALRAGRVLCLLSDRVVAATPGVSVDFFGGSAQLPAGPVTLALRTGAAVLPAAVYFSEGGGHLAVVRPPLRLSRGTGRLRAAVEAGTQALARELEVLIRADPTQWYVFQPVWSDEQVT